MGANSESGQTGVVTAAAAPFDNRCGADIIFRASDNVDFYLHKSILSLTSSFFEGMFSLSQPLNTAPVSESVISPTPDNPLPIVEVSEDSLTLDCILRYCYPGRSPPLKDLHILDCVLGAAIKYALEISVEDITDLLRNFVETQPLQVYAIACRHHCEDEARLAAQTWKKSRDEWSSGAATFAETCAALCYAPEIGSLPAGAYFRLIQFVMEAGDSSNIKFSIPPGPTDASITEPIDATVYPSNQTGADIVLRSTEGMDFKIHRMVVELQLAATPVYPIQAVLLSAPLHGVVVDGLPVIQTTERSIVLYYLLQLCYPYPAFPPMPAENMDIFSLAAINTAAAALRYGLLSVAKRYQKHLRQATGERLLPAYCISTSLGWYNTAAHIASSMMSDPELSVPTLYDSKLEMLAAGEYYHLLEYCYQYEKAELEIHTKCSPEHTQWRQHWQLGGRPGRQILSSLVELEVNRAIRSLAEDKKYKYSLKSLTFKNKTMMSKLEK